MKLTDREKRLIAALIVVAALALYYQYIVYPKWSRISQLKAVYASAEQEYGASAKGLNPSNIMTSVKKYEDQLAAYNEYIPEYLNAEDFAVQMYKWARSSGVDIKSIQFDQQRESGQQRENKAGGYKEYPIVVDATGSYQALINFMTLVQNSKRLATIKDVSLSRSENSINAILDISIYYIKDSFAAGKLKMYNGKGDPFKPLLGPAQKGSSKAVGGQTATGQVDESVTGQLKDTINQLIDSIGKKQNGGR
ncbi:type 4a pilus biogenesis protein PilO [Caldanaerobius polysaccharolyticus]|uniref:type 4a pilus biogenesis protein PilO n=1 Tax=Caldanaerobius polysaccharolyticus TaxID=44256 RepID=UPI00047A7DFC|nr:type 4a pilus biogenesis protein PilO [Caldanaerobius polysaccharolyticus]